MYNFFMDKNKIISLNLFLISIFLIFGNFNVYASIKWKILDNFKAREYDLIFKSNWLWVDAQNEDIVNTSKRLTIFNNIADNIEESRTNLETQKDILSTKILTLEESIRELDQEIDKATKDFANTNEQINETQNKISINKKTVDILQRKVDKNREILMQYLNYLYKKSNYVYDNKSVDNLKAIIFSWDDISKIINDLHFKSIIEVTWKTLIDNHRKFISELYIKTIELNEEEKTLKKLRKDLIMSRKVLSDKKEYKNKLLSVSKWKESLYQKYIEDKLALEKSIKLKLFREYIKFNSVKDNLLKKYNCNVSNSLVVTNDDSNEKCRILSKTLTNESMLTWFDSWSKINLFSWPVFPWRWISAYFKDAWYKAVLWSSHDAIDIPTPQWTPIYMPADWYVTFIEPPASEDYSYIAIKHSDWFTSVYWHVSEILVNNLDFVKKWTVFAKSGWWKWTKWAWIMTSWPHLHFELWKNQEVVDPLNYMDTSLLSYNSLLEKYKYKFLKDFKARKWEEYQIDKSNQKKWVFVLEWDNETQRQQSLIKKYATSSFSDWNMWVEEWLDWKIDPSFIMCVWLAETWLWRNLKTQFNVWNIWNTDSWDVIVFPNARAWIYAMVKALNNRYLWWYNKISDLSRYWNSKWAIYASSSDHWHNNIIKCMSHLKWEYIPDDYNFRRN